MKAGNYGNLLVQIEQPRGEYAVTIAFLRLITTLVKVTFFKSYVIFQKCCPATIMCIMCTYFYHRVSSAALRTKV